MEKSKKTKPVKDKVFLEWLHKNGFFAEKIYLDGLVVVLAVKDGSPYTLCLGSKHKVDKNNVIGKFKKAGGQHRCLSSISDLEHYFAKG